MKRFLRSKLVLTLAALVIIAAAVVIPFSGPITQSFAASRSSHNIAYVNYDDSGFTGGGGNIFSTSIIGGPASTSSVTASVTYNGMTFTPLAKSAVSSSTLANYDTLILFEVCDIATSLSSSQHDAINAYLAAGNKIILFDGDRCAPNAGGNADYSWFKYPFTTSNPGPQGATGTLTVVENSTLTQGLASDPFNLDELGDANTATTSDPHWFAAAKTTNALGNNGYFLAYARNTGLIIYDGADHWATDGRTKSLTDLFLNELNQQYDPDNLPSSTPIAPGPSPTPQPVVRKAPFDFNKAESGLVDCNSSVVLGTGIARVGSDPKTGHLQEALSAKSQFGQAVGKAGVGVTYTAPKSGRIKIGTDVSVSGFNAATLINVGIGIGKLKVSVPALAFFASAVEIHVYRFNPRRDNVQDTNFAHKIDTSADIGPDTFLDLPFSIPQVDLTNYIPPKTFSASIQLNVTAGDKLFICAGLKSDVGVFHPVPFLFATAEVGYGKLKSGDTRVQDIRIAYV